MIQNLYFYEGPVTQFNKIINTSWSRYTKAVSPKKALSNLQYSYKITNNLTRDSKIELPGTLTLINGEDI
jgi:hypothetical protein